MHLRPAFRLTDDPSGSTVEPGNGGYLGDVRLTHLNEVIRGAPLPLQAPERAFDGGRLGQSSDDDRNGKHGGDGRGRRHARSEECDIGSSRCARRWTAQLSRLAAIASCRRVEAGRTLFEEGDRPSRSTRSRRARSSSTS